MKSYLDILNWVKLYVYNEDEAQTLANQLHYISCKRKRNAVAIGIVIGWVTFWIVLRWLS